MKNFLYKNRQGVVFVMQVALYVLLLVTLFLLLGINNPQILRLSRTTAIMLFTFVVSQYLLMQIYGKFDIGVRKSKPIIISVLLSTLFADAITFIVLIIMNTNETTDNQVYPYLVSDILRTVVAYLIQAGIIVGFTYGGHSIYFSFVPPENCLIISPRATSVTPLTKAIGHYKKQYRIGEVMHIEDEGLKDAILRHDSVFLYNLSHKEAAELLQFAYSHRKNVYRSMEVADLVTNTSRIMLLDDKSILNSTFKEKNMHQRIVKRLADIVISLVGMIICAPFVGIVAIAIKLEDGGKVFFKQQRVTIGGRFFQVYKLRSMKENADGSMVKKEKDGRITRVGYVIRKFRFDEVPQFINVFKGDMSIVGPRAEMADRVFINTQRLPEYAYRYSMKAGLTGYAQIYGKYNTPAKDKLTLDLTYIQTFSLWNDTKILFQTILVLLRPDKSTEAYNKFEELEQKKTLEKVQKEVRKGTKNKENK